MFLSFCIKKIFSLFIPNNSLESLCRQKLKGICISNYLKSRGWYLFHLTNFPIGLRALFGFLLSHLSVAIATAQTPQGVWVTSHELRVGTYQDLNIDDQQILSAMKNYLSEDSVYSEGGWILMADSANQIEFLSDIRSSMQKAKHSKDGEMLRFERDSFYLEVMSDSDLLLTRKFYDSFWHEYHFHRLPDSILDKEDFELAFPKTGAHLELYVSDTLDRNYQLDFIDARQVVITGTKEGMPYTVRGTWHSRWIGNTLFFSFFDNHFEKMQLYFFYGDSANALIGGTYNSAALMGTEPPQLYTTLASAERSDNSEKIKKDIVGTWEAVNEPLFYDPAIEFGFLSYQSFEITFDADGSFSMLKSGTVLKRGDSIPLEEEKRGKWEMGPMGRYIALTPIEGNPFYFSLQKVNAQEMVAYCLLKTLSEFPNYNVFENRKVELKK